MRLPISRSPPPRTSSPRSTAIAVEDLSLSNVKSATNHYHLPNSGSEQQLGGGWSSSSRILQHELLINSYAGCQDVGAGFSLPPAPVGRHNPHRPYQAGLDWTSGLDIFCILQPVNALLLKVGVPPVHPPPQAHHRAPSTPVFCQEVHSQVKTAIVVRAAPAASRSSTPPSNKLKHNKRKTIMCKNGLYCRFGKDCSFAHGTDQLEQFTPEELRQRQKRPNDYFLSHPCLSYVMCGDCCFKENCRFLHDPRVRGREGSPSSRGVFVRATSLCKPSLVDRLRHVFLNSITQENALVDDFLWKMRGDLDRDEFEETCNFIANTHEFISDIFKLPFDVPNDTEKLSIAHKMAIALLMHQKSRFSEPEDTSFQAHLDFTFSSRSGTFLDGTSCMILQARCFKIESGCDIVEEVPFQSSGLTNIITAYEVVFGAKGSTTCKHSLWFDATIVKSKDEVKKVDVHSVHSKPYVFMEPIDNAKEGYELIHSIMEEMIGRRGGPMPSELREKFIRLNNSYRNLAWPKTKPPSAESAATSKSMADHVGSEYNIEGGKVKSIWDRFVTNLHDEAPEGGSRLSVFSQIKAKGGRRSVVFVSSLPKLSKSKDDKNIADFLADYSQ